MKRRQFENAEGGYLSTGFTLSFDEIKEGVPDSISGLCEVWTWRQVSL